MKVQDHKLKIKITSHANAGIGTTLDIDTREEFNKQNLGL